MSMQTLDHPAIGSRRTARPYGTTIGAEIAGIDLGWAKHSVAFWDNRAGVDYVARDDGGYPRVIERVLIANDDTPHRVRPDLQDRAA